jgi:hypothetical protein
MNCSAFINGKGKIPVLNNELLNEDVWESGGMTASFVNLCTRWR